ncbi:hypothetical protein [Sphingomicrobium lutaoense]|uniref:Putative lipid-binding transport protein (Tim44 family) n=1 Tax=Sphingomicrobium lutaoense TaxID=515949 RepID=A0A839Z2P1_9SPHN|nr:hypothetical protein [Sphingomicrobium lutaoense]MBB3764023.1 putative lipid-binding transport protein (Tim44 family) [Sphingomicrobium lutaoense]
MSFTDQTRTIERATAGIERALVASRKTDQTLARYERIAERMDARAGNLDAARQRELRRVAGDVGGRLARIGVAVGLISLLTIGIGLFIPIGMFGFLAAVGLAIGVAALMAFWPSEKRGGPPVPAELPNAEMVARFDRYLYRTRRALPAPAQAEVDQISSQLSDLGAILKRLDEGDPQAREARRLMSDHLPGLIERYAQVPAGYRDSIDGEGMSVDERLTDGLAAGRKALEELGEELARRDIAGLETHGRFLKSRYGRDEIE